MPLNLLPKDGIALLFPQAFERLAADTALLNLLETINWQAENLILFGRSVPVPRLVAWHGDRPYTYSGIRHDPQPWTPLLLNLRATAEALAGTRFNSVLLNLYRDGRDSMGWHADDERELGVDPIIASLSFGAARKFQMRHRHDKTLRIEMELTHGSCLVMAGTMQKNWQHQIPKTTRDVGPRVNLTFRMIV